MRQAERKAWYDHLYGFAIARSGEICHQKSAKQYFLAKSACDSDNECPQLSAARAAEMRTRLERASESGSAGC